MHSHYLLIWDNQPQINTGKERETSIHNEVSGHLRFPRAAVWEEKALQKHFLFDFWKINKTYLFLGVLVNYFCLVLLCALGKDWIFPRGISKSPLIACFIILTLYFCDNHNMNKTKSGNAKALWLSNSSLFCSL